MEKSVAPLKVVGPTTPGKNRNRSYLFCHQQRLFTITVIYFDTSNSAKESRELSFFK